MTSVVRMYASTNSPFCTRVTIAARAKGIDIEDVYPPIIAGLGLKNSEYLAINPIGKIPTLISADGQVIPESEAILHYLEDRFPHPSLLARDPEQRAWMNVAVRVMETYVMTPIFRTYPHLNTATRDQQAVDREVSLWKAGLANLAELMESHGSWPEVEAGVSLTDCVLAPALHLSTRIAAMLGLEEDPMQPHEVLALYYLQMKSNPFVGPSLDELTAAQAAYDAKAGRPSVAHRHL